MYVSDRKQLRSITISESLDDCFLCGKSVSLPCIFWLSNSTGNDLWLHPSCGASFILRLGRDVHEHKLRSGKDVGFIG